MIALTLSVECAKVGAEFNGGLLTGSFSGGLLSGKRLLMRGGSVQLLLRVRTTDKTRGGLDALLQWLTVVE